MHLLDSAISLNVPDPEASAAFLQEHLGFDVAMADDGFVSLRHPDGGPNVVLLRTGLESFKPVDRAGSAGEGLLLAFVVESVDVEFERMVAAGVPVVTAPETEPWGERYCQVADPNGLTIQLVEWVS
jgi:catechol 2,3-dioxygenase-like lactoylglutathione lyase family enzyme